MNKVAGLLALCVVCAALKAALTVLVVALALTALLSFITRPRETLVFIGTFALLGLANTRPLACIITLGIVGIVAVVAGAKRTPRNQLRLTDGREHHSN